LWAYANLGLPRSRTDIRTIADGRNAVADQPDSYNSGDDTEYAGYVGDHTQRDIRSGADQFADDRYSHG
jgi:hypothetical protein